MAKVPEITYEDELIQDEEKGAQEYTTQTSTDLSLPERSCFYFTLDNKFRKICIWLMRSQWFDRATLLIILLSCIMMSIYNYCEEQLDCKTEKCLTAIVMDNLIFSYFVLEMICKMIGMGVYGKNAYFTDNWNKLDFFIVLTGAAEYIVKVLEWETNLTALRILRIVRRILRPLRAVNRVAALRIVTHMVLDTVPMLLNVLLVCCIVFFVFGLVAVQLWAGLLRARCIPRGEIPLNFTSLTVNTTNYYVDPLYGDYVCSLPENGGLHQCQDLISQNESCLNSAPINYTFTSANCMLDEYDSCIQTDTNPFLGVINFDNIFYAWITIFVVISMDGWSDIMYLVQDVHSFWDLIYFVLLIVIGAMFTVNLFLVVMTTQISITKARELSTMEEENRKIQQERNSEDSDSLASFESRTDVKSGMYGMLLHLAIKSCRKASGNFPKIMCRMKPNEELLEQQEAAVTVKNGKMTSAIQLHMIEPKTACRLKLSVLRMHVKHITESDIFSRIILLAIILNSLSMAIEYHNQPEWMTTAIEISNYIFTAVFTVEMCMKIFGHGCYGYIKDLFNVFDCVIVIISLMEVGKFGPGGLSVLRTFRLLRLIKLIKFLPVLRQLLSVIIDTLDEIAVFLGLFCLVILIFSLTGMILFGQRLSSRIESMEPCSCSDLASDQNECFTLRINFDSFFNAALSVFQVLTTDNWRMVFFNAMSRTSHWSAAIYFITLFTVGNYVMLNLVVAILVQGCMDHSQKLRGPASRKQSTLSRQTSEADKSFLTASINAPCLEIPIKKSVDKEHQKDILFIQLLSNEELLNINSLQITCQSENSKAIIDGPVLNETDMCNLMVPDDAGCVQRFIDEGDTEKMARLAKKFGGRFKTPDMDLGASASSYKTTCSHSSTRPTKVEENRQRLSPFHEWPTFRHPVTQNEKEYMLQMSDNREELLGMVGTSALVHESMNSNNSQSGPQLAKRFGSLRNFQNLKCWNYSCLCLPETNSFRKACIWAVKQKWFDSFVLVFIMINCVTMAFERPSILPDSQERLLLDIANYIFTVIFLIEMMIKVTAWGLIFPETAYVRSGWNILDGCLVVISLINVTFDLLAGEAPQIFGIIRILRLLRALRPLRVINRAPGLKVTIESLVRSIKDLGNLMMLSLAFFIIFGILGVQLFKGIMHYCDGPSIANVTTKEDCLKASSANKWINAKFNFDNLAEALMTLYVVSTMDGWVSIMHGAVDAVGIDLQPVQDFNKWRALFFVPFIVLMTFLIMNMMIGVLVDNYYEAHAQMKDEDRKRKQELKAEKNKSKRQRRLSMLRKSSLYQFHLKLIGKSESTVARSIKKSQPPFKKKLKVLVDNRKFDIAIGIIIALNISVMAMEHFQMSLEMEIAQRISNYIFTIIFLMEAIAKIYALSFRAYISERWNQLDLVIVILSIIGIVVQEIVSGSSLGAKTKLLRILRMVRITRVLKLLKQATGFMSLVNTMGHALPQIGNLGLLLGLQLYIFSAVAVELFGRIECSLAHPCEALSVEHANFANFGMAMLTLFIVTTGDNWSGILKDTLKDDCDSSSSCLTNCCVNTVFAQLYFVTFVVLTQFILLNVVVALMMKGFTEAQQGTHYTQIIEKKLEEPEEDAEIDASIIV